MASGDTTWSSYLPDGRPVRVEWSAEGWRASCEERSAESDDLVRALEEATGVDDHGAALSGDTAAALRRWIAENAARIEADALRRR